MDVFFPYEKKRLGQDSFMVALQEGIVSGRGCVVHAPTGLGKTVSALAPLLPLVIEKKLTIFFLTSRHTQHHIVTETLQLMKEKFSKDIVATSIIGKKHMCALENVDVLPSSDFHEYCKSLCGDGKCSFFENSGKSNVKFRVCVDESSRESPLSAEDVVSRGKSAEVCPYELAMSVGEKAHVIVCDYYYLLHSAIRQGFLSKLKKSLEDAIIIFDEGHNVPQRARELLSDKLTSVTLMRAIKECKKFGVENSISLLVELQDALNKLGASLKKDEERRVSMNSFFDAVNRIKPYDDIIAELEEVGTRLLEEQKQSSVMAVARFLSVWKGNDEGFVRLVSLRETRFGPAINVVYRCLDPSLVTREVIEQAKLSVVMSGTLTPVEMYRDVLGFPKNAFVEEFASPFPHENRLALIVPKTTTKFTKRSPEMFERIARVCADVVNAVPGNGAVFFPSYVLLREVNVFLQFLVKKTMYVEEPGLSSEDRKLLLDKFRNETRAVLLGVASGSFGEGIDLPGVLDSVVVVGLPLGKPDIETQELIKFYDKKFGKGWDYGYTMPAIAKTLQNAGRCIRSETDRGVLVFLDERFAWPQYLRCFPTDWKLKITQNYVAEIEKFFSAPNPTPKNV